MIRTILALCSRDFGHEDMYFRLNQALSFFETSQSSWSCLIQEAEKQGVSSLLNKHICVLNFNLPGNVRRLLQSLYLRNRRSNTIRNNAVAEILKSFSLEKIDVLVVKGIALCNYAYSEIGFRPMRDIDLLVKKIDLVKAEKILFDLGYLPDAKHGIPDDYYHLIPMGKTVDGLYVCVELHHNLLPFHPQYPLWPIEKSYDTALKIEINGELARTLCLEDTLWYVYLHGFQAPLTYEPYRCMHVADMVSVIEKFFDIINWQRINRDTPTLLNIISRFHYLTPLQDKVLAQLKLDIRKQPQGTGHPYKGWPKCKVATVKKRELLQLAIDTLWPSQWWMQVYYGHLRGGDYMKARLIDHPLMVLRWAKAYWYFYVRNLRK